MVPGTRRVVPTPENSQASGRDRQDAHKNTAMGVGVGEQGGRSLLKRSGQEASQRRDSCPGLEG